MDTLMNMSSKVQCRKIVRKVRVLYLEISQSSSTVDLIIISVINSNGIPKDDS